MFKPIIILIALVFLIIFFFVFINNCFLNEFQLKCKTIQEEQTKEIKREQEYRQKRYEKFINENKDKKFYIVEVRGYGGRHAITRNYYANKIEKIGNNIYIEPEKIEISGNYLFREVLAIEYFEEYEYEKMLQRRF